MRDESPTVLSRRSVLHGLLGAAAATLIAPWPAGCDGPSSGGEIVLYTSVDQPIAVKVVAAFEKANPGAKVRLVTDTEATKSVGLAARLRAEQANPRCHVWWGNEVFHTIGLADEGLFAPLGGLAPEILPAYRDPQDRWAGNGLRARVLAVGESAGPIAGSLDDLLDPRFKGKVTLARPLAGTTGGHVAALYALWGDAKADEFFAKLKANGAILVGSNSEVARQVGAGNFALGLTDNDDVQAILRSRGELWQVVPDQAQGQIGTLTIPTTVALVKRDDLPPLARTLAAFLLSEEAERLLIAEHFAAFSVRQTPDTVRPMDVRYEAVARRMTTAPKRVADLFDER